MYGGECWESTKKDMSRIHSGDMKLLGSVKGCIRQNRIPNEHISADLSIYNINGKICEYKYHIDRTDPCGPPKIIRITDREGNEMSDSQGRNALVESGAGNMCSP